MRAPFQILAIPYQIVDGSPKYCVFHRADHDQWQFIAGGGEDNETPLEAAKRETIEEGGVHADKWIELKSSAYIPVTIISEKRRQHWDKNTYVIPEYTFGFECKKDIQLKESHRLLKDDGKLFSAALTPYSVLVSRLAVYHENDTKKRKELDDPAVISIIERALVDGCYINPERKIANGLGSSHLHTAKALREELSCGGFDTLSVHGVMGGAWLAPNLNELLENEETRKVLMKTVRMLDTHEEIIGLSGHLLAVSRKEAKT